MDMTIYAQWLNNTFGAIDEAVATFAFSLHEGAAGGFFDWFFPNFTHLGDEGLLFIALGLIFLLFAKTRKAGMSSLIALLFGLFLTNMFLKVLIARPRPYVDELGIFNHFWQVIGHGLESEGGSFPSGHTTSAFAAMTAVFWALDKRYSWTGFILAGLLAFSRIYVHVHYFSDILGGILVGFLAGSLAFLLINLIYKKLEKTDAPASRFIQKSSILNLFPKKA